MEGFSAEKMEDGEEVKFAAIRIDGEVFTGRHHFEAYASYQKNTPTVFTRKPKLLKRDL